MKAPHGEGYRLNSPRDGRGIGGRDLLLLFEAGLRSLESQIDELNRINVFPVPDGDTGSNMFHTLRTTLATIDSSHTATIAAVAAAVEENALYNARGNSGVILAEFLRGFCSVLRASGEADTATFAQALRSGADAARAAVDKPVEGTVLTVMEEAAAEGLRAIRETEKLPELLDRITAAAELSLQETPRLLPALQEAGVFDAGAAGFSAILQGMAFPYDGRRDRPTGAFPPPDSSVRRSGQNAPVAGERSAPYGYCTELLLSGPGLDRTVIRSELARLGESLLVIGSSSLLRIHVHSTDPGAVLSTCLKRGSIHNVSIRNMDDQADERRENEQRTGAPTEGSGTGTVIVAAVDGEGFAEIFRSLGAHIVEVGEVGTGERLLERAQSITAGEVVLLPNRTETLGTLERLQKQRGGRVQIAATRTMIEGVAALIEWNPERELGDNLERMNRAASAIRTVAIDRHAGVFVAAIADEQVASASTLGGLVPAIGKLSGASVELCTLYYSDPAKKENTDELIAALRDAFAEAQVEVHYGGQSEPLFLLSLE